MQNVSAQFHARELATGLSRLQPDLNATFARLSSGNRLDQPAVDVAGTGRAAKLDAEQARFRAVEVNLQNGASRLQSTVGHLTVMSRVLSRLSELATLAVGNPAQNSWDTAQYDAEFRQLQDQLRATIGGTTAEIGGTADIASPLGTFQGRTLFGPGPGETLTVGLLAPDNVTLPVANLRTGATRAVIAQDGAGDHTLAINSPTTAGVLRDALDQVTASLAVVGSVESRVQQAGALAVTRRTNQEAALSAIRDTDIATETTRLSRLQMVQEAHTAMLAQAREATQSLLPLLAR